MNKRPGHRKILKYSHVVLVLFFFASTVFGAYFYIMSEELSPFNHTEDGKVTGFSSEIVLEICERVGHAKTIQVMPWARAYKSILNEDNKVLFSTTRTANREDLFKWVGPI